MNHEQMQALGRVLEHFGHDEVRHYQEAGNSPAGHIAEALLALDNYRQARSLEMDDERKGRPPRDDGTCYPTAGSPIGIVRDHPSHDEDTPTEHLIIWALLPLAKLPNTVANLVKDAVHGDLDEQCRAALAAVDAIARLRREPDAEIPF